MHAVAQADSVEARAQSPHGSRYIRATATRQQSASERVSALLNNARDMDVLHRVLHGAAGIDGGSSLSRVALFDIVRAHTGLGAPLDLRLFFDGLEEASMVTPLWKKDISYRPPSSARVRINPPAQRVADVTAPTSPVANTAVVVLSPNLAANVFHDVRGTIERLRTRQEELRAAHEEFLRIESELATIRELLD